MLELARFVVATSAEVTAFTFGFNPLAANATGAVAAIVKGGHTNLVAWRNQLHLNNPKLNRLAKAHPLK